MAPFIIAGIAVCIVMFIIIRTVRSRQAVDFYIRHSFGDAERVKDDVLDRLDSIALFYEKEKENYSDSELVDDITWEDLDMKSVFFRVNHTDCFAGEQYLYSALHTLGSHVALSEETISFFDGNEAKRNEVRRVLYSIGKPISSYYSINSEEDIKDRYLPRRHIYPVLLAALILSGALAAILRSPAFAMLCILIYLVNLVICIFTKISYSGKLETLFCTGVTINGAFTLNEKLPEMSGSIAAPLKKLKKAARIISFLNMERSMTSSDDLLSSLLSYVTEPLFIKYILYNKGVSELADKTKEYLEVFRYVGGIDCSIAVASFRRSLSQFCVPEIREDRVLEFRGVFHPMLADPVANDLMQSRSVIITGSNASGKSTFIKAVAINLILAQTICTCTAEYAYVPRCGVITSMAIRDDLLSGESYYIREIKYLKRMVELSDEGRLLFLAIDEILKGTNNTERVAASKAVLRYFAERNCMLMIATHDMEIARAFEGEFDNHHFCETLEDGEISFDYTIHDGMSRTSNAIRLLSVMGFPEKIVSDAMSELQ